MDVYTGINRCEERLNFMSERKAALDMALRQIEKQFGKGSIMKLGEKPKVNVNAIPTGSIGLDAALGIGGMPRGRIVEIFGPESSGKTTLSDMVRSHITFNFIFWFFTKLHYGFISEL